MELLTRKDEPGRKWYPTSISDLDDLLIKVISQGHGYQHPYALRRNLCYNLQYLEYLDATLRQIKLSDVLVTQTWKTFILTGCGIIESLLKFLLIKNNAHSTTIWQPTHAYPGAEKTIDGKRQKVDSQVFEKLSSPVLSQMTFDGMIGRAKAKKVLGNDTHVYEKLESLRKLRNRVHLQQIEHPTDTDWNAFQRSDFNDMRLVLHSVLTSNIFRPSREEKAYFEYLQTIA